MESNHGALDLDKDWRISPMNVACRTERRPYLWQENAKIRFLEFEMNDLTKVNMDDIITKYRTSVCVLSLTERLKKCTFLAYKDSLLAS